MRPLHPRLFGNGLLLIFVILSADLATKWYVEQVLMQPPRLIEVTSFFNLVLHWNRGVSFGMLTNDHSLMPYALMGLALLIIALLLRWLWRAETRLQMVGLGLIIGGALGNVTDRVLYGAVRDFLDFHALGWHWPAFNIADSGVVVGVGLILLDGLVSRPKNR